MDWKGALDHAAVNYYVRSSCSGKLRAQKASVSERWAQCWLHLRLPQYVSIHCNTGLVGPVLTLSKQDWSIVPHRLLFHPFRKACDSCLKRTLTDTMSCRLCKTEPGCLAHRFGVMVHVCCLYWLLFVNWLMWHYIYYIYVLGSPAGNQVFFGTCYQLPDKALYVLQIYIAFACTSGF